MYKVHYYLRSRWDTGRDFLILLNLHSTAVPHGEFPTSQISREDFNDFTDW
jgi:hypothetical protein